ncbi:MAG: peptidylprolyl isomerase [Planctomycetota bacterium]|nr:peptidylprolyl isomerase [Planctomycetota bacterium]
MWNLRDRRLKNRVKSKQHLESIQALEDRALLAGNVVASLNGGHLSVTGDASANQLEVTVSNNQVVLRGMTDTTINGSTSVFVIADNTDTAPGNITIQTGAGNDTVIFSRNVKVAGHVFLDGGTENDSLSVTGATFRQSVSIYGRTGNDTISVQNATVDGILRVKGNAGDDLISLTNVTTNSGLRVIGGAGADGVSLNNVTTNSWTEIKTGAGDDNITIRDSDINGFLRVKTRQGSDILDMDGNTVNGVTAINMGRATDFVRLRNTNTFNGAFRVQAGDGNADAVDTGTATVFSAGRRIRKSEGTTADFSTNVSRIDDATTGLRARATAADDAAASLLNLDITLDNSANTTESSVGGVLITRNATYTVAGTTLLGATVTLDTNNDGVFDAGTLTADNAGRFSTTVTLQRTDLNPATAENDQLNGLNKIKIRSTVAGVGTRDAEVNVDFVPSTNKIAKFTTNEGTYEVELFNSLTPNTVANFLSYSDRYTNAIVQRSVNNFVIQAGGFTVANNGVSAVAKNPAVLVNEFNSATSNLRGTLSMALPPGQPDGGSSEWFVNTVNNGGSPNNLDAAKHTVFGRVIGNGMTVVDKIAALSITDLTTASGNSALSTVPLRVPFTELSRVLTGTVSTTAGSTTITGVGPSFLTLKWHGLTNSREWPNAASGVD